MSRSLRRLSGRRRGPNSAPCRGVPSLLLHPGRLSASAAPRCPMGWATCRLRPPTCRLRPPTYRLRPPTCRLRPPTLGGHLDRLPCAEPLISGGDSLVTRQRRSFLVSQRK